MRADNTATSQPQLVGANDDLSVAERALRDQYCGHLDVKKDEPAAQETVIVDAHAFEHSAAVKTAVKETEATPEAADTHKFHLEGVTLDEATKLMEKHKGSRLMLLVPEDECV